MRDLVSLLRDLVWPAVIAVLLGVATVTVALVAPDRLSLVLGLGLTAVTSALLAARS